MRAVTFAEFGPPEVLQVGERPDPQPGPGEVCVRVVAATVNPTDLLMRSGQQAALMTGLAPPWTAGMEFAGRVDSEHPGFAVGQPVIGVVNPRRPAGGAHAERVCVPAASVAGVAETVDLVAAATVPMNALTASMALAMLGLAPGQSVLVTGGAGMLGGFAIQLARLAGLTVAATGRDEQSALLTELGADLVVPRGEALAASVRRAFPAGVDGLIDGALIGRQVAALVRDGGGAVSLRRSHPIDDPRLRTGYVSVVDGMEDQATLGRIATLLGEGRLRPRVAEGGRFPFTRAVEANRLAEQPGLHGRVVLTFAAAGEAAG